jgi:4-amino-4-deoxy-L-arabinose transferase-like glycosyltransferase
MRSAERAVLVGIVLAIAAALRIGFVTSGTVLHPLRADAGQYAQYAANLYAHGVFSLAAEVPPAPDSFRSPGYPAFLWLCRVLGGEGGWMSTAIWLQVALGVLTVFAVQRVAQRLGGFWPSLLACVLAALSPHLVVSSAFVLTECLTTALVALGCQALLSGAGPLTAARVVTGGLLLGAAVLCNETLVVLPVALAFALWPQGRRHALLLLLVALLPFGGWAVRNRVQPLARTGSERAWASISHGSYPGMVFRDPRLVGFPYREDPEQPAFGASAADLWRVLGPRIAAEPLRYLVWYAVEKPMWLWRWDLVQGCGVCVYDVANSPYERQAVMQASHAGMRWLHLPVMVAAAIGALVGLLRHRRGARWQWHALGACAVAGTLAYLPVIPDPRYLQPVRPLLFVLAAVTLAGAVAWIRGRRSHAAPAAEPNAAPMA